MNDTYLSYCCPVDDDVGIVCLFYFLSSDFNDEIILLESTLLCR
jgi:hypothetical protein